jgi:hypothetical protein
VRGRAEFHKAAHMGGTSAPGFEPAAAWEFYYTEPFKSQRRQKEESGAGAGQKAGAAARQRPPRGARWRQQLTSNV